MAHRHARRPGEDEGGTPQGPAYVTPSSSGPRIGVIVAIAVVAGLAWLALA